jgi:hypothetical protein
MTDHRKARGGEKRERRPLPMPGQMTFTRAEQLRTLRHCVVPGGQGKDGGGVAGTTLKLVLRILDDHAGGNYECWPSHDTIAREAGLKHRRQAIRATEALEAMSLICVRRASPPGVGRGGTVNHYRIVWNELHLLCPSESPAEDLDACDQSAMDGTLVRDDSRATKVPLVSDQSAMGGTTKVPYMAHEAPNEAPKKRPPPPKPPLPEDWAAVVNEFAGRQSAIHVLADEHRAGGYTPDQFRERLSQAWAVVALPANRGRFTKPAGAVAWFLRNGSWPAERVATPEASAVHQARRAAQSAARADAARHEAEQTAAAEDREALYGPFLDALGEEELQDLIERTPALRDPFFARWLRQRPPQGTVRMMLLRTLADFL